MPPPTLPFPDPAIPLAQAIASIATCYPDNAAIRSLTRQATCHDASYSDLEALLSLVIGAALCAARNPDPNCCEADPFIVDNLLVAENWLTDGSLTVHAGGLVQGNVTVTGNVCFRRNFTPSHLGTDLILAVDETGCLKFFPRSDLDYTSLHLPGNLIVDGATQLNTLHQYEDATFAGDFQVTGNLHVDGKICGLNLADTTWSSDAGLVFIRNGCLRKTGPGICCQTVVGCCPPFTFDPDAIGYPDPDIFPELNPPDGANTQCELPLYALAALPFPPTGWAKTEVMVTSGLMADSGYAPGLSFGLVYRDDAPVPALLGALYFNNGTSSWQTTEPNFGADGDVTYQTVFFLALGYIALEGSTSPGHEYLKPLYDGGTFDVDHLCPGDS